MGLLSRQFYGYFLSLSLEWVATDEIVTFLNPGPSGPMATRLSTFPNSTLTTHLFFLLNGVGREELGGRTCRKPSRVEQAPPAKAGA